MSTKTRQSIFNVFGLPDAFGVVVLSLGLAVMLSPYASGMRIGTVEIPSFDANTAQMLKVVGPITFALIVSLFVPMIPTRRPAQQAHSEGVRNPKSESMILFSAVRPSERDRHWEMDQLAPIANLNKATKPTERYPFSKLAASKFSCRDCIFVSGGVDPVLDITIVNRSEHAVVFSDIGMEVVRVAYVLERRGAMGLPEAIRIPVMDSYVLEVPDTFTLLSHAIEERGTESLFELATNVVSMTRVPDPIYLKPEAPFRFELVLRHFCPRTPLHAVIELIIRGGDLESRSPPIYFRW